MKYDVFISYKRDGGSVWAELIRAILVHKYHLKVFLDVETVRGGEWPKQLDDGIRNSYNIIMVLFEGIGDKIKSDSDVFVQEIEYAKEYEKPIIPFYGLGCDLLYILENKNIPSIIKEVVSIQHSIVKYDHTNSEKTYDLLRKQLNGNLELKITSKYSPCYMSCQLNNEPPYETKEIEEKEWEATAGGGAVKVKISGKKEIVAVELSEEVVDPDDIEMLQDLIMAATNEALRMMEEESTEAMSQIAGGLGGLGGGFPF